MKKEDFLSKASAAYDEWLAQNPDSRNAYDFETWFLEFSRSLLVSIFQCLLADAQSSLARLRQCIGGIIQISNS